MSDNSFTFGQKIADDYVPAESDGAQWIRGFKDASTPIRIMEATGINARGETVTGYKAWHTEREHYDEDLQISYPCPRENGGTEPDGVGCSHPSKKVRDRSRKYYINAVDKDGELRIFKIGPAVYNILKMRQDRMIGENPSEKQPLSRRDYIINKSGSGMNTKYDVETGDKYELDEVPTEMHDIGAALTAAWNEALAKYNGDEAIETDETDEPEDRAVQTRIGAKQTPVQDDEPPARPAAKKAAATKKAAASKPAPAAAETAEIDKTEEDLEDMELPELRAWVEAHVAPDFEVPARAPRSRLFKIGQALINGEDPVPF